MKILTKHFGLAVGP